MAAFDTYERDSPDLKEEAVNSTKWGFLDKGTGIVLQLVTGVVLARLLPPADFGLLGLAMIVVQFGEIFVNMGMGPSLIQKQELDERHIRVAFTVTGLVGIVLAFTVYLGAPLAALVFDNQQVVPVVKALSVLFVISGFMIPGKALLKKQLNFRRLFHVSFSRAIAYGIITIGLALSGFGIWSLVIGNIVERLLSLAGYYGFARHSIRPLLSRKELSDLAYFGTGITLSKIFNVLALKGDYYMIGRFLGANTLGLYTKAYSLMQMPTQYFVSVLSEIYFPAASRIQNNEKRLRQAFLKGMRVISFFTFPVCLLLVIVANELIVGLYGPNWQGAVLPLQILAVFGVFRAMYNAGLAFLSAKGWIYMIFSAQIVYGILMLAGVWGGIQLFGIEGACWAVGITIFMMWSMIMELNAHALKIRRRDIVKSLSAGLTSALLVGITTLLFKQGMMEIMDHHLPLLILASVFALFIYVAAIFLLPQKIFNHLPREILKTLESQVPGKAEKFYSKLLTYLEK